MKGDQKAVAARAEKSVGVEVSQHKYYSVAHLLHLSGSTQVQMAEKDPRNAVVDLSAKQTPCLPPVARGGRGVTALLGTKHASVMTTTALHVCEPRTRTNTPNQKLTVDNTFRVTIKPP